MANTLPLLRGGSVSLEDALSDDDNVLHRLDYPKKQEEFWSYLVSRKSEIEAIVSFHLRAKHCQVVDESQWLYGSYNVCIPVYINWPSDDRVLIRIPLPYKIGEANNPGNVDEKLRCEVATYTWIREHCPTVPIPSLYAFAFPNGHTFAEPRSASLFSRICWHTTRAIRSLLGLPRSCPYIHLTSLSSMTTGYMITSFVSNGRLLSDTWQMHLDNKERRKTLFHEIARIMLSINRTPLPHIGSLTLDDDGFVHLTNRPLTLRLQTLENEGVPTIPRHCTYRSIEPYILDILQCHDNRIYYQPNAIHTTNDGEQQQAALTMMRGLLPQFVSTEYRGGPFVLTLTDLHPSNIFVDEDWNITSLIDLEWACSFPIEMQTPPYWLTGRPIDDIEHGEHLEAFENVMNEFIDAFEAQETNVNHSKTSSFQANILRKCWDRGSFWYFQAVHSPKGMLRVFIEHIQRRYCEDHCTQRVFDHTVSPYWCIGAADVVEKKLAEETEYKNQLRKRFTVGRE
ncbi:hypothetical protein FQN50_005460 [Emmonsiellopsis sp. PD_5]|nr:hypothetical protein FQN50_005460 [Emmonsiellopsis sp. PD_5]